jgi:multidrug efflux pump subunit AcrB
MTLRPGWASNTPLKTKRRPWVAVSTVKPQAALRIPGEAALNRLRPITMSTLAMILALLPLGAAISGSGDQMLQPLAIAIIAGITVQLPIVLLAMPVVIGLTVRE